MVKICSNILDVLEIIKNQRFTHDFVIMLVLICIVSDILWFYRTEEFLLQIRIKILHLISWILINDSVQCIKILKREINICICVLMLKINTLKFLIDWLKILSQ